MPAPITAVALRAELTAAGADLVGNDDVLRSVLAASGDCIKIIDLEGRLQFMSEGGKRVMEVDDFAALKGCPWPDFWQGEGNKSAREALATARAGGVGRFQGAAETAKGTPRYWDVQVSPIFDHGGKPVHLLSVSRDITEEWRATEELREAARRQTLLADELQHRVKNTLAMVNAIAHQTLRGDSVPRARDGFMSRIVALSDAHDILTQTSWASAPIADIITGALLPHRTGAADRIYTDGPGVMLDPKRALSLALAVHELATNAAKYGALSADDGRVTITWTNSKADGGFRFDWSEAGGPSVTQPSSTGFGTRLIEGMLAADFGGKVLTAYHSHGLLCILTAPMVGETVED